MSTKQPFIRPQCEHRSAYDPWVESAHCPNCSHTPSDTEPPHVPEHISSTQDLAPLISERDHVPTTCPPATLSLTCPCCTAILEDYER